MQGKGVQVCSSVVSCSVVQKEMSKIVHIRYGQDFYGKEFQVLL